MTDTNTFDPAPLAELQRRRSYARGSETWDETCDRTLYSQHLGLLTLGQFTDEEIKLIDQMQRQRKAFGSARWLWVGGTEWIERPECYPAAFNCTNFRIINWESFGLLMDLSMQGTGTGSIVEMDCIQQLPEINNKLDFEIIGQPGDLPHGKRHDSTLVDRDLEGGFCTIKVGDSREGWVKAYQTILELSSEKAWSGTIRVKIILSAIRPSGEKLKGFGGTANPIRLAKTFENCCKIINKAQGRQLNALEVCLLLDEASSAVVAGNLRRSASIHQGSQDDPIFAAAKDNLWQPNEKSEWYIDPERDALRMANHTRVFHQKPTKEDCLDAVRKQFASGEGAIQWAGEAVSRGSVDLLTKSCKKIFLGLYSKDRSEAAKYLKFLSPKMSESELAHRMQRYALNPCAEIISSEFFCNLGSIHLNKLDPFDLQEQKRAFRASALQASAFLKRSFDKERYQTSRDIDPIVGVSFTGAFTFFVKALGVRWLQWWDEGRPEQWGENAVWAPLDSSSFSQSNTEVWEFESEYFLARECEYLSLWKEVVHETVWDYCDRHSLKRPNRCTALKPEGSLTLLTGVGCNGFHPPKGWHYIRRITFAKDHPIALAAMDYGYSVVPSQSDKDESGNLLTDPLDPRCTEWLIEVPVKEEIVHLFPEAIDINPNSFSALAQFSWYMQVQKFYTSHNTSATLEMREEEVEPLAHRIYQAIQNDEGYISAALLARFDAPFPRLPFEVIDRATYDQLQQAVLARRTSDDFQSLVDRYSQGKVQELEESACNDGVCALK